jgi:hypothetical protein
MAQTLDGPIVINGTLEVKGATTVDGDFSASGLHIVFLNGNIHANGEVMCSDVKTGDVTTADVLIAGKSLVARLQTFESETAQSLTIAKAAQAAVANLQSAITIANALGAKVTQLQNSVDTLGKQQTQQLASLESQIGALAAKVGG